MFDDCDRIQRRERQRQVFLKSLKKIIFEAEEEYLSDKEVIDEAVRSAFHYNLMLSLGTYIVLPSSTLGEHYSQRLLNKLLAATMSFTSVRAEQMYLLCNILESAVEEIRLPFGKMMLQYSIPPHREWFLKQTGLDKLEE